jgi:hypothetical protein
MLKAHCFRRYGSGADIILVGLYGTVNFTQRSSEPSGV